MYITVYYEWQACSIQIQRGLVTSVTSNGKYCLFQLEFSDMKEKENGLLTFSVHVVKKLLP